LVGANLFAKALFLKIHPQWMYRPLREQCGPPPRSLPRVRIPVKHLPFTTTAHPYLGATGIF
ncbi:hypothetical protein ALQ55_02451, partial [Pseudomonas savastanoi pv. savastanoi]